MTQAEQAPRLHARLSPSAAHRWMDCAASAVLETGQSDESSVHADEGTAAHTLAERCLTQQRDAASFIGEVIKVNDREFTVDAEMAAYVQVYVSKVYEYVAGGDLYVEQAVPIGHLTGEAGATGTSDAIGLMFVDEELQAHDLKYGRGVKVYAETWEAVGPSENEEHGQFIDRDGCLVHVREDGIWKRKLNEQAMFYLLGALEQFSLFGTFSRFRIVIHQPRLEHVSEAEVSLEELNAFVERVKNATELVHMARHSVVEWHKDPQALYYRPGEKQCQWCKAKATCPALAAAVEDAVGANIVSIPDITDMDALVPGEEDPHALSFKMQALGMIEDWIKAVRARVESLLLQGKPVPGYKLVEGRRGSRAWTDEAAVEAALKSMRLKQDEMYTFKVISPAAAEKLLKENPRKWAKLEELITQSPGKPSVAPVSDKRPALVIGDVTAGFEDNSAIEGLV